jgi:hypothetical protein
MAVKRMELYLSKEVVEGVKAKAKQTYGDRKGGISYYVEAVLRTHLGIRSEVER